MEYRTWPCPLPGGGVAEETALAFAGTAKPRVLVVPALLDEEPRLRRFTVEVMRRLASAGFGCMLPDLPGTHESLLPLASQTLGDWRLAMVGASRHFAATHVLALRGGGLVAPAEMPGWCYAPATGATQLRNLLRAQGLARREAGQELSSDALLAQARAQGMDFAGMHLGPEMIAELLSAVPAERPRRIITADALGTTAPGLWLRAEPGEDPAAADALAAIIAVGLGEVAA